MEIDLLIVIFLHNVIAPCVNDFSIGRSHYVAGHRIKSIALESHCNNIMSTEGVISQFMFLHGESSMTPRKFRFVSMIHT